MFQPLIDCSSATVCCRLVLGFSLMCCVIMKSPADFFKLTAHAQAVWGLTNENEMKTVPTAKQSAFPDSQLV